MAKSIFKVKQKKMNKILQFETKKNISFVFGIQEKLNETQTILVTFAVGRQLGLGARTGTTSVVVQIA